MKEGVDLSGIVVIENAKRSKKTKQLLITIAGTLCYVKQLKYPLLYNVFEKSSLGRHCTQAINYAPSFIYRQDIVPCAHLLTLRLDQIFAATINHVTEPILLFFVAGHVKVLWRAELTEHPSNLDII